VTPNCTQAGTSQQTSGLFGAPNQTDTRITSGNTSQQSVTQGTLHDSVAGTPLTNSSTSPYNFTGQSISKPLALGISPKVKSQIWSNEYVDLGSSINTKFSKQPYTIVEPHGGGFALEKRNPPTYQFDSVSHWLSAFHVFVGIYSEKYPNEIGSLMKYAHTIQNLARLSCDIAVFMYDKTFRQWRETAWVYLPWDQVNSELYNDAMHLGLQIKLNLSGKLLSTKTMPKTFQRPPFPNKPLMKGVAKNTHTATVLTTIMANVKEDKIVNTPMCVENVEGHILDKYAQKNEEPNFDRAKFLLANNSPKLPQNKLVHLINKLDNNSVVTGVVRLG
jgi:hypothetical protein